MGSKRQNEEKDPLIGQIIGGKFQVTALVRRGGMARVYKGLQQPLGRAVAIKVLAPQNTSLVPEGVYEKRFFREASVASRLTHPNSVIIHDYGRMDDPPYFYIVMEYLDGITLRQAIQRGAPMPVGRMLHITEQVCGSLLEAHTVGVVHRDLKPANIMLVRRGDDPDFVKVLDFGLVKPVEASSDDELTVDGTFVGSPGYMAPEQILGEQADQRADIYSMGVLMYEMFTGKTPFPVARAGPQNMGVVYAQISADPIPMRSVMPELMVPPYLERAVMRCIQRDPEDRFPSIDRLLSALRGYDVPDSSGEGVAPTVADRAPDRAALEAAKPAPIQLVTADEVKPSLTGAVPVEPPPIPEAPRQAASRSGWIAGGVLVTAAVLIGVGVFVGQVTSDRPEPAQPSTPVGTVPDAVADAAPAPRSDEVVLLFDSSPDGAGVFEGAVFLGLTPIKVRVPRVSLEGDRPRVFLVRKDGFAVFRHDQWATDEKEVRVFARLDPEPEVVPKGVGPKPAGKGGQ